MYSHIRQHIRQLFDFFQPIQASLTFSSKQTMPQPPRGSLNFFNQRWFDNEVRRWANSEVLKKLSEDPRSWVELVVVLAMAFMILRWITLQVRQIPITGITRDDTPQPVPDQAQSSGKKPKLAIPSKKEN